MHCDESAWTGAIQGLRVGLLEHDAASRSQAEVALHALGYQTSSFGSLVDLATYLGSSPDSKAQEFDVLLADVDALPISSNGSSAAGFSSGSSRGASSSSVMSALVGCGVPLVLTSSQSSPSLVFHGINQLGAVDFLEKPLSMLKLKNIWQHKVRRMMSSSGGSTPGACATSPSPPPRRCVLRRSKSAAVSAPSAAAAADALDAACKQAVQQATATAAARGGAAPQQQQSAGSHSGPGGGRAGVAGEGGHCTSGGTVEAGGACAESGSVMSTSDGTRPGAGAGGYCSSMGRVDSTQVAGLACGLSHLMVHGEEEGMEPELGVGHADGLLGDMSVLLGGSSSKATQPGQPQGVPGSARAPSAATPPAQVAPRRCQSAMLPGEVGAGVALGHASGRLPDLPEGQPGLVWGLPASPLKLVPMPHCMSPPPGLMPMLPMLPMMMGCMGPPGPMLGAPQFGMPPFMPGATGVVPGQGPMPLAADPMQGALGFPPMFPGHMMAGHPGMIPTPATPAPSPSHAQAHMHAGMMAAAGSMPAPYGSTAAPSPAPAPPGPGPAAPSPSAGKPKGTRSSTRRAAGHTAFASGAATAAAAPAAAAGQLHAPVMQAQPQVRDPNAGLLGCGSAVLLDPLAVLEGREDDLLMSDALQPLDPSLLDSGMTDGGGWADLSGAGADATDLDWLLLPPSGGRHSDSAQPLALPKSASLVDMVHMIMDMDRMDHNGHVAAAPAGPTEAVGPEAEAPAAKAAPKRSSSRRQQQQQQAQRSAM